jgi:poly-D-alanine transfer protein DltD
VVADPDLYSFELLHKDPGVKISLYLKKAKLKTEPYVFGPPGSASISHRYESGYGSGSGSEPYPSIIKQK